MEGRRPGFHRVVMAANEKATAITLSTAYSTQMDRWADGGWRRSGKNLWTAVVSTESTLHNTLCRRIS